MKFLTRITPLRQSCCFRLLIFFLLPAFATHSQSVISNSGVTDPVAAGTYYATNSNQYAWDEINAKDPTHANTGNSGVYSMAAISYTNNTSDQFHAWYYNLSTQITYEFDFYPGFSNWYVGQIPYGNYDVSILRRNSSSAYYNFYVVGYWDTDTFYFIRNNLDFNCDCGYVEIEYN